MPAQAEREELPLDSGIEAGGSSSLESNASASSLYPRTVDWFRERRVRDIEMRTILLGAGVAVATALCSCGGSRAVPKTASRGSSPAAASDLPSCSNPSQCSTATSGQLMSDVTISNPSDVPAVTGALHTEFDAMLQSTDQKLGSVLEQSFVVDQSQCAPVGSLVGQFPANDYLCGGVVESTTSGQENYALPILFNVRSDGTVYAVGSPCSDSTPASSCDPTYWSMVQSQALVAATAALSAPAPTTRNSGSGSAGPGNATPSPERYFHSPSRNIQCELNNGSAGLSARAYCQTQTPPASVAMTANGTLTKCAGLGCLGDPGDNTVQDLPYGRAISLARFHCISMTSGVWCTVPDGRGFAISREGINTQLPGSSSTGSGAPAPTTSTGSAAAAPVLATDQWRRAGCDISAYQSADYLRIAADLQAASSAKYGVQIRALKRLAALPDTELSAQQGVTLRAEMQKLDTFFKTPGLNLTASASCS